MARLNAANQASTTLAENIDNTVTSFTVVDVSPFPDPPFMVTVGDEIMEVRAKDAETNTFSDVVRGAEGTTPAAHNQGDSVENRHTAGAMNRIWDDLDAHLADYAKHLADYADLLVELDMEV